MESTKVETAAILPSLPEHLAAELFAGATPRHLKSGEALFHLGGSGDGCYRLEKGLLKVVISSPRGDDRILAVLGPGSLTGELALIDGGPRSASVFAIRDSQLSFIRRKIFEQCTQQHPEIYLYLVKVLAARLRETDETVAAANFMTVEARLARALLDLARHFREQDNAERIVITHKVRQSDLAAMAGVARENVNRVLSDWSRRQIVTRTSGFYSLNDLAALRKKADA
jgi:CRP/FNR family transcriptional regulator, cyclic AMP receptor protein